MAENQFDVIIIGTGIGGTMVGAILARHNYRVLMIEKGAHPRFTIGEAVVPTSSLLMRIIGERYDVPEIALLSNAKSIQQQITTSCGVKTTNGFLYHRAGERQNPKECNLLIPHPPLIDPPHLYRQEIDHYMLKVAMNYGAIYRERTTVCNISFHNESVTVETEAGDQFKCRYLIDAAGTHSPLAHKFNLRVDPAEIRTHSRVLFTHMKNVPHYDDVADPPNDPGLSLQWRDGTLHHIFDGGWFWTIPFDNVAGSTNQLCSVGLCLDPRKYPDTGLASEEEFQQFLRRFPSIAAQLGQAEAVRPWVKTGRIQYLSRSCVGDRYFLLPHSYGFFDALQSKGLVCTCEVINLFADRLLSALADNDLSAARFADLDQVQARLADFVDRHIANFYRSFADFSLWNAWLRIHVVMVTLCFSAVVCRYAKYAASGNKALFGEWEGEPFPSSLYPNLEGIQAIFNDAEAFVLCFERGELTAQEAAAQINSLLSHNEYVPPLLDWADSQCIHMDNVAEKAQEVSMWAKTKAPAALYHQVFDFDRAALVFPALTENQSVSGLETSVLHSTAV